MTADCRQTSLPQQRSVADHYLVNADQSLRMERVNFPTIDCVQCGWYRLLCFSQPLAVTFAALYSLLVTNYDA